MHLQQVNKTMPTHSLGLAKSQIKLTVLPDKTNRPLYIPFCRVHLQSALAEINRHGRFTRLPQLARLAHNGFQHGLVLHARDAFYTCGLSCMRPFMIEWK